MARRRPGTGCSGSARPRSSSSPTTTAGSTPTTSSTTSEHFVDDRVDAVTGPGVRMGRRSPRMVRQVGNHLMIGGWNGPAFASGRCSPVATAASGRERACDRRMGREHPDTRRRRGLLGQAASHAGAMLVYDPKARLLHLGRLEGANGLPVGQRARRQLAGARRLPVYNLANRPPYDAWAMSPRARPMPLLAHQAPSLLGRREAAAARRWRRSRSPCGDGSRGRRLIDATSADREVQARFPRRRWRSGAGGCQPSRPRTVLPHRDLPQLPQ